MISIFLACVSAGPAAAAEVDATGFVEIDHRYRLSDLPAGPWYAPRGVSAGVERLRGIVGGELRVREGDATSTFAGRLEAHAGTNAETLAGLSDPEKVMPLRLRVDELAVELWDFGFKGLDLKLGHQVVQWGVGDQFNPTNTLNSEDLEDPLKFGTQLPNVMVRADYSMSATWTLSGVLVPVFRPSALPATSSVGTAFIDRMPVLEDDLRRELQAAQALARDGTNTPTIVRDTDLRLPSNGPENMQGMVRLGGAVGMQDLAVSWYTGRSGIPQPVSNFTERQDKRLCHPTEQSRCIDGYLLTDATMEYPRMHVAGLNGAGEINLLGFVGAQPLGWRVEAAMVMPQRMTIAIENADLELSDGLVQPAGEYDYGLDGERPTVVAGEPFAKWTVGFDYTFGKAVYVNAQWVHGMVDEFGSGDFLNPGFVTRSGDADWEIRRHRLGDYLVLGSDIALGGPVLRLFSLFDLSGYRTENTSGDGVATTAHSPFSEEGFSAVFYPELMVPLQSGLQLSAGAVAMFGKPYTKFGDPAAGGTLAFAKASQRF